MSILEYGYSSDFIPITEDKYLELGQGIDENWEWRIVDSDENAVTEWQSATSSDEAIQTAKKFCKI